MSGGRRTRRSSTGRAMVPRGGGRRGGMGQSARIGTGVAIVLVVLAALFFLLRAWAPQSRAGEARQDHDAALATSREGLRKFPQDEALLHSEVDQKGRPASR